MNIVEIFDINDFRLELYTKFNEVQLQHYFEPNGGVFIAETPMVIERALEREAKPLSFLIEKKAFESQTINDLLSSLETENINIFVAELEVINKLTGFNLTRGVLAAMRRPDFPEIKELLSNAKRVAVLEEVQNPTNVGAIFRSAAALGVDAVILTSGCTDPFYRRAARVSMGTVFQVPWCYLPKHIDINETFHKYGFKTVAMALKDDAISLDNPILKKQEKLAIIFGTEATGITDDTIKNSDFTTIIPMHHDVDSLNVAAASAVTFWELCRN